MKIKKLFQRLLLLTTFILFMMIIFQYIDNYITNKEIESITVFKDKDILNNKEYFDLLRYTYSNSEIVGELSILNTNINNLVVQTDNNEYYLNHLVNNKVNVTGSLFVDYRSDIINGKKVIIYGHNSKRHNVPFKNLEKFLDKDFFNNNRYIYFKNEIELNVYEIFSLKVVPTDYSEHVKMDFKSKTKWMEHLYSLKENSLYSRNIELNYDSKILILQTCNYTEKDKTLLLIIAKKG